MSQHGGGQVGAGTGASVSEQARGAEAEVSVRRRPRRDKGGRRTEMSGVTDKRGRQYGRVKTQVDT